MRVGYVRCSTIEQNEARQLKMMEEQKAEKLFIDKASGKNTDRKAFKEMMGFVRAGDMVIVESISRIARNTRDLLSIVSELTEKQVEFVSLKENIDTTTPQGRFMLTVFGALAELERENILERQREGIAIAKDAGKYKGRKPLEVDEAQFKDACKRWRAGEITATAAMQEVGLKPHLIPLSRDIASSTIIPATNFDTPCVLPEQPPSNSTLSILSPSTTTSMRREQVPLVL